MLKGNGTLLLEDKRYLSLAKVKWEEIWLGKKCVIMFFLNGRNVFYCWGGQDHVRECQVFIVKAEKMHPRRRNFIYHPKKC